MKTTPSRSFIGIAILLLALLACNMSSATQPTPETVIIYVTETNASTAPPASEPVLPPVNHILYPADTQTVGEINYDVDSRDTAPEQRAPYGDIYRFNNFERPFTSITMDYLPDADIVKFRLQADPDWYYIFIELGGVNPATGTLEADYGVELDLDLDGIGDYLIWSKPPYTTSWQTDGVSVYEDTNHDSAGLSITRSDAPFNGNGYDKTIFDSGQGEDADLAWVRIDPRSATTIQFAFKKALAGNAFMWGVWADLGLKDPTRFSYNDYFTEEQAGSPEKSETEYYPVKAVHSVDNTCRGAYGFDVTGNEPFLCIVEQPTPVPHIAGCVNPSQYVNQTSCVAAGCAWRRSSFAAAVIYYCTYP